MYEPKIWTLKTGYLNKNFNPLTPGAFSKNAFFGHFGDFHARYRPN